MAYDPATTMNALKSFAQGQGHIQHVQLGEPAMPPLGHVSVAILLESLAPSDTVLDAAVHLHTLIARFYRSYDDEDGEQTELDIATAVGTFLSDLEGDTTLGGADSVRGVEVLGLSADLGYLEIEELRYRTADVRVPITVDEPSGSLAQ